MDGSIFWFFGGALVVAALVISFYGIRHKESFPPSGAALAGVGLLFGFIVIGTAAYGWANASEEQDHRNKELAEEEAHAAEEEQPQAAEAGAAPAAQAPAPAPPAGPAPGETLDVTSPADGSLVFDPDGLEAQAGVITLAYENPSPVPHSIAIEDDQGQTLDESETVTNAGTDAGAELAPGEFVYYCTVPGHRESGMEGTLTVR